MPASGRLSSPLAEGCLVSIMATVILCRSIGVIPNALGAAAVGIIFREGDILAMTASDFAIYLAAGGLDLLVEAALA